jgi:L-ascorbate 6-phosphate lactonase
MIKLLPLGQVGYRLDIDGTVIYIDPYLSNSVQEKEDKDLNRLFPLPLKPNEIDDADFVLITHFHRDHCDEDTVIPISICSPRCKFIAPKNVVDYLTSIGIDSDKFQCILKDPILLTKSIRLYPTPAAHPNIEYDSNGGWRFLGYILEIKNKRIYHAGDTSLDKLLIDFITKIGRIDLAFIPVNERNYFRESKGIIGNMSVREAFGFAEALGVETLVPTHWDMFESNQVFREEIEILYSKLKPPFKLEFYPNNFKL